MNETDFKKIGIEKVFTLINVSLFYIKIVKRDLSWKFLLSNSTHREYPCDHYTSVITVTLVITGCPRVDIQATGLQLLQLLDKRFFGSVGLLQNEKDKGKSNLNFNGLKNISQNVSTIINKCCLLTFRFVNSLKTAFYWNSFISCL